MSIPFKVVIPARYASTRLPGKPLLNILQKPMIQWVYEAALQSQAEQVIVATDDDRIIEAVSAFGGESCKTRSDHETGTDRIVEVTQKMAWPDDSIIVNLQGDEPLMPAQNLTQVAENLHQSGHEMATLYKTISPETADDPNLVKLVCDKSGRALYFSRSKIPFERDDEKALFFGHIGLYAYRVGFLKIYAALEPCRLEQCEKLEQLRALYHGFGIHCAEAQLTPGQGVDTPEDLEAVSRLIKRSLT